MRIVGAHLRAHPKRTLAAEGAAMAQERSRLEHLHQDDLDVRAAIQLSYRHVSSADQRLFLLLGLLPGPDIGIDALARLADLDRAAAQAGLERLVDSQLLEEATASGRFHLHDLLRIFARELLESEAPAAVQQAAWSRLAWWYVTATGESIRVLDSGARHPAAHVLPAKPSDLPDDAEQSLLLNALAWFDAEYRRILAAIEHCYRAGQWALVRDLAGALPEFLSALSLWIDWQHSHELALSACRILHDRPGESTTLHNLGIVYRRQGRSAEAIACHEQVGHLPCAGRPPRRGPDAVQSRQCLRRAGPLDGGHYLLQAEP